MQIRITGFGYTLVDGDHALVVIIGCTLAIVLVNLAACRLYGIKYGKEEKHD